VEETRGFRCGANDETDSIGARSAKADRAESELKQEARSSYAKRRGRVSNAVVVQEERRTEPNNMPPRTIGKSRRPRASDRTVVEEVEMS
jgi:hypothetical protein